MTSKLLGIFMTDGLFRSGHYRQTAVIPPPSLSWPFRTKRNRVISPGRRQCLTHPSERKVHTFASPIIILVWATKPPNAQSGNADHPLHAITRVPDFFWRCVCVACVFRALCRAFFFIEDPHVSPPPDPPPAPRSTLAYARAAVGPISVDRTRCVKCGACVRACPFGALTLSADLGQRDPPSPSRLVACAWSCLHCFFRLPLPEVSALTQAHTGERGSCSATWHA